MVLIENPWFVCVRGTEDLSFIADISDAAWEWMDSTVGPSLHGSVRLVSYRLRPQSQYAR